MSESVGEIHVEIGADISKLPRQIEELEKKLKELLKRAGDQGGDALVRQLTEAIREAKDRLRTLEDTLKPKVEPDVDARGAQARLAALQRDRKTNIWVTVRGNAAKELSKMIQGLSGFSMLERWRQNLIGLISNLPQLTLTIGKVSTAVAALVVPLLSSATAIAPLASSLASIGPLALAAIPAIAGFAGTVGVLVAAFRNLSKSTSPAAQSFNTFIKGIKSELGTLRTAIQENFFGGGFTAAFKNMIATLFPAFSAGIKRMATDVSNSVGALIAGITAGFSGGGLETLFSNLSTASQAAEGGFRAIGEAVAIIAVKAGPALQILGTEFTIMARRFSAWASDTDIGGLLTVAIGQAKELFRLVGNLGGVLSGLFSAMDTGNSTGLTSMADALARVRNVVQGSGFQDTMRLIFEGANTGAEALTRALGPLGSMFQKLAPLISNVLATLGGVAGTVLIEIANALSQPVVAGGLSDALQGIATLMTNIPFDALGQALGIVASAIGQIAPLVTSLLQALAPMLPPILSAVAALIPPLVQIVQTLLPPLVAIIQGVLIPVVQALNPILNALVPVFKAISSVIMAIMPILSALVNAILAGLVPAVRNMSDVWVAAGRFISGVFNFIAPLFNIFVNLIKGGLQVIGLLLKGDFSGAWQKAQAVANQALQGIQSFIGSVGPRIVSALRTVGETMMKGFGDAIRSGWNTVSSWLGDLGSRIKGAVGNLGNLLVGAGQAVLEGFLRGLRSIWDNIQNFIGNIASWIQAHKGPLSKDRNLLVPAGKAIMSGFYRALESGFADSQKLVKSFSLPGVGGLALAGAQAANNGVNSAGSMGTQNVADFSGMTVTVTTAEDMRILRDFVSMARRNARAEGGGALNGWLVGE